MPAYKTVSKDAMLMIVGRAPIERLVRERINQYETSAEKRDGKVETTRTVIKWREGPGEWKSELVEDNHH